MSCSDPNEAASKADPRWGHSACFPRSAPNFPSPPPSFLPRFIFIPPPSNVAVPSPVETPFARGVGGCGAAFGSGGRGGGRGGRCEPRFCPAPRRKKRENKRVGGLPAADRCRCGERGAGGSELRCVPGARPAAGVRLRPPGPRAALYRWYMHVKRKCARGSACPGLRAHQEATGAVGSVPPAAIVTPPVACFAPPRPFWLRAAVSGEIPAAIPHPRSGKTPGNPVGIASTEKMAAFGAKVPSGSPRVTLRLRKDLL